MNKAQKIIWTVYVVVFFTLLIRSTIDVYDDALGTYVILAWIPTLILSFMWREKKDKK